MPTFWNLTNPDIERRLADAPEGEEIRFLEVHCPLEPKDHFGLRGRISPLSVVLPSLKPQDFVWTWVSECLVQERVLQLFRSERFTGYDAIPVQRVEFAHPLKKPPKLWEIVVKGSGGMASPQSGIRALRVCPGCGLTDYSRVTDPTAYIDPSQWDGSDFFRVKPVSGKIFVTDRVIQALRENAITGWRARSLADLQEDFDIALPGDSAVLN